MRQLSRLKTYLLQRYMQSLTSEKQQDLPQQVHNIALWQFGGVGDMLLITPAIAALGQRYPDATIHVWCSFPQFASFLKQFPQVATVSLFPIYDFDMRTLMQGERRKQLQACIDAMNMQNINLLVNLHLPRLLDWWAVEWSVIAKIRPAYSMGINPDSVSGSIYQTSLAQADIQGKHFTQIYQMLLQQAGIPCGRGLQFPLSQAEKAAAATLLQQVKGRRWVCLHTGARRLALEDKLWPAADFIALAHKLQADGLQPVLLGVESEQELGKALVDSLPQALNLIGKTSLGEMAAVIERASLFIGHDSGPFHMAVAMNTPAVVICGRPDAEAEYLKYDRSDVRLLTAAKPELITVADVYLAAKGLCP